MQKLFRRVFLKRLKEILYNVISSQVPKSEPVALLFSGGTDSLTVFWTLQDLGVPVTCYTFRLTHYQSTDSIVSKMACEHWKTPHKIITEDTRPKIEQVKSVIKIIKSYRKTHVEVMYGYYFLLQAINERHVFSGLQADTLFGSNKNAAIKCRNMDAKGFANYRRELYLNPNQEGLYPAYTLATHFKKILHTPYTHQTVRDFLCQYSWRELNSPKQKMPSIIAFKERFLEIPIYRHDDNFQCCSRIREHLHTLVPQYRKIYDETN